MHGIVNNRADLKRFIEADQKVNEDEGIRRYLRLLRRYELIVKKYKQGGGN